MEKPLKKRVTANHLRASVLLSRYASSVKPSLPWEEDPQPLLDWFRSLSREFSHGTYVRYRSCLASHVDGLGYPGVAEGLRGCESGEEWVKRMDGLVDQLSVTPKNREVAGSLVEGDKGLLEEWLLSMRGSGYRYKHGIMAATWLHLTSVTGLRPVEWKDARLLSDVPGPEGEVYKWVLDLKTAKQDNRAQDVGLVGGSVDCSPSTDPSIGGKAERRRRLILDDWAEEQVLALQAFLAEVGESLELGAFDKLYADVRQTLIRASKAAGFDNSIGLYTARHLFSTEVRRSGAYSRYELAALMGHADCSNQKHYGGRDWSGGRVFGYPLPKPWPGAAQAVEEQDRKWNPIVYKGRGGARAVDSSGAKVGPE